MAQPWQQGQPGFQYPLQTGIPPNFQQQPQPGFGGIQPQPTGFLGRPQPGFGQQPSNFQLQPTGFQQSQPTGFQQSQPTGFPGPGGVGVGFQNSAYGGGAGSSFQHRAPPAPPPVPQIPSRFQSQVAPPPPPIPQGQPSFLSQPPPQSRSFISPQQTGFVPQGGLVPQVTGYVDPRLQVIGGAFMPANVASPYSSAGLPQFAQSQNLQQSIQQINQTRGTTTPKIPWALSKAEKKEYDKIFRAWDTSGSGFISGETALQVFGQSGLDKNDLARIWSLADIDDRGKLSLPEFHVAMGLIYRCLNGNTIPDQLPPELIPPSRKDLDSSVDFVKGLLSNETRPGGITNDSVSRLPTRSFNGNTAENANTRKDGTIYKYNDDETSSYKPSNRHINRRNVRTGNESPSSDLTEMRRQLEDASKSLDRASAESASRTAEDDALDKEMEDLKYRVRRVQDDLEYVSRGPSSFSKDEERRKLERDLLNLMHERLPELERRIKDRERRKAREKEDWARSRDRANDKYSRFDDGYSSRRDRYRDEDDDNHGYLRGTFERDDRRPPSRNEREHDRRDRDRDREHDRDRDYGRGSSYRERDYDKDRERERDRSLDRNPRGARSPPPVPPPTVSVSARAAPPAPSSSPLPTKNMTAEERRVYLQEQAARRVEERKRALGVATPAPPSSAAAAPVIDSSVQDRIDAERKEAEEKVQRAERELEERERLRQERLQNAKEAFEPRGGPPAASPPAPAPPPPTASRAKAAPPPPVRKTAPRPPVAPRVSSGATVPAPAPPRAAPPISAPTVSRQPSAPVTPQIDPEEEALRAREESLKKEREARAARLRELEAQEEEERRKEDELQARRIAFLEAKAAATRAPAASPVPPPAPTPTSRVRAPPPPAPAPPPIRNDNVAAASSPVPPPPPVEPVAPPPPAVISTPSGSQTNPFNRLLSQGSTAGTPPATSGGTNPFARPQPAPVTAPTPPPGKAVYPTAAIDSDTDWDDIEKPEEDDSSDEELDRKKFSNLAATIFGGPSSPSPAPSTTPTKAMSPAIPSAPPPPPAPIPPPPPAPVAPPVPTTPLASVGSAPSSGDRGALFSQIAGGVPKLRKTVTNDRSTAATTGVVLGDAAPPPHVVAAGSPSPPSPAVLYTQEESAASESSVVARDNHRQSVDWYGDLAANASILQASIPPPQVPATVQEEDEYVEVSPTTSIPAIQVNAPVGEPNPLEDIDLNTKYRVRSLYSYQGQRNEDLVFEENLVIEAHPSKSGGDWWYGSIVRSGKTGFFPATYVQQLESVKAKTLYAYAGGSPDELPFSEGEELTLIDRTEGDWWKTERDGMVFIVPAAYLEIVEVPEEESSSSVNPKYDISSVSNLPVIGRTDENGSKMEGNINSSDDTESDSASEVDEDQLPRSEEEIRQDREARKNERMRVLEAAGIVIKDGGKQAPPPVSRNRRRPAPARPSSHSGTVRDSVTSITSITSNRDLPPIPDEARSMDSVKSDKPQLDDAYERYEAFKQQLDQRASIASYDSILPLSPDTLTSGSPKPQEGKGRHSHLLSFLGRRTPANDGERRSVSSLVISAPILTGSVSVSRENSPAFGSSWSSLMDKEALEDIPDSERRRQEVVILDQSLCIKFNLPLKAIFEFIATENAYLRDLQLLVETFYASLMPKLDPKAITVIFANVEDILLTNTTFLSSLEERQKECRLYIDNIADVLESNMSKMGLYMQYCVNTGNAIKFLQSLRDSRPEIAAHLQQLRDDPVVRGLDLSSYILTPMQRITRYPLLIRQIINYTHEQQELRRLEKSVAEIERILDAINEAIRANESQDRLRQISQSLWIEQGRLDLTQPTRYMGPRKLLKEGALFKTKGSKKLHGILCNDILILAEDSARSLYRMPIPLTALRVEELAGRNDLDFKLVLAYPRGGETIHLRATSARDAQNWIKHIEQTREKCIQAERRTPT